jgi:hypothetical protein
MDVFRIKVRERVERIDGITPHGPPLIRRQGPECLKPAPVCEMWPQTVIENDPAQRRARDVLLNDRFLSHQFQALSPFKRFQQPVLV